MRRSLTRLALNLIGAALIWCLTYIIGAAIGLPAFPVGLLAISWLAWRAASCAREVPRDWVGAILLSAVIVAFAVSLFLPLWEHSAFYYNEDGERIITSHEHTLLELDHIH